MTTFTFSIKAALRTCWSILMRHPWFYLGLTLIMVVLNIPADFYGDQNLLLEIGTLIISLVFSYVWLSVFLAAVDGKDELLSFSALGKHLPTVKQFILLIEVGILSAILTVLGFVALIIPGIYIITRLVFAQFALVDTKGRAINAMKDSWRLVRKDVFWTVLVTLLTVICLVIVGAIIFGVGLIVAYPLATLLLAYLYRQLTLRTPGEASVEPVVETSLAAKEAEIV